MPERRVGAQRAEERLLERVLGPVAPDPADEQPEHLVAVLGVEALEGRDHGELPSSMETPSSGVP